MILTDMHDLSLSYGCSIDIWVTLLFIPESLQFFSSGAVNSRGGFQVWRRCQLYGEEAPYRVDV